MSEYGRAVFCPYFKDEKKRSISCEDTVRHFDSKTEKRKWFDNYCCAWEWEKCPYAMSITKAWIAHEKGDETALEKQKTEAMQSEIRSLSTKLGRAYKKIDELVELNKSYLRRNDELEKQKSAYYKRWRKESVGGLTETVLSQASDLFDKYKDVLCYLLSMYGDKIGEDEVEAWKKGRVYTIYREYDENGKLIWQMIEEEVDEDGKNKTQDTEDESGSDNVQDTAEE